MAIVFPKKENPYWPLPPDYPDLDSEGQRMARVNACSITGKPEYDVAAWQCFRQFYLIPEAWSWYKTGFTASPQAHSQWVYDWHKYPLLVHCAPRGTSKTTVNLEDIARQMLCFKGWECLLFLSTIKFCGDRLGRLMDLVDSNPRIIRDFGHMRGKVWNRSSEMKLSNGSRVIASPIKGASLGQRPSGLIVLDDVEKADEHVITPSDLRQLMKEFFFNGIYPMSRSPGRSIPIRIIGTQYNNRMFISWLHRTDDSRIEGFWKRTKMTIFDMGWDVFGPEWIDLEKKKIGPAAFSAQYCNEPATDSAKMLDIHPELCTYWFEKEDAFAVKDPFGSNAVVVTHQLAGWEKEEGEKSEPIPTSKPVRRLWREVVSNMRRFITVDWAPTTHPDSDYSVVHVMGFENDDAHKDTLYSLDIWWGRVRPEELLRIVYQMSMRWQASLVGVEAYPLLSEFYERVRDDLPGMYGSGTMPPRVIPIKFPPKVDKASKIMGLEWRFVQFRIKLPSDRKQKNPGYGRLFWEIENATEDLAMLDHDDCVDSLAMHQAIGKPHKAAGPDRIQTTDPNQLIQQGTLVDEVTGLSVLSGINASELTPKSLRMLLDSRHQELEDEYGEDWQEQFNGTLDYMGVTKDFFLA